MRISRLFAASMLSVTALAVVLGGEVLVPQAQKYLSKSEAIRNVEAFGAVLAVYQRVVGSRAPYITALFQDDSATQAQRDAMARMAQADEVVIAKARVTVAVLDGEGMILDGLNHALDKFSDIEPLPSYT